MLLTSIASRLSMRNAFRMTRPALHTSAPVYTELWKKTNFDTTDRFLSDRPHAIGRAWDVHALRRKDWNDLHQLWWVLLRERNRLMTRAAELKTYSEFDLTPFSRDVTDRFNKVKESMDNVKLVVDERYNAWLKAQNLWAMKLEGVDIDDPSVVRHIDRLERDRDIIKSIRRIGRFTKHRGMLFVKRVKYLKKEALETYRAVNYHRRTRLRMSETDSVIDLLPVYDRRHLSRKRIAKVAGRSRHFVKK